MTGKCPHCDKTITTVVAEKMKIEIGQATWQGVSYYCPLCSSILSIQADPVAIKQDVISELTRVIELWSSK